MRKTFLGSEDGTCSRQTRYIIVFFAALLVVSFTVLRTERTAQAVGTPAGGIPSVSPGNSGANITAAVDCGTNEVKITSTKDISYVKFDDQRGKYDGLSGKDLSYPLEDATKVWVKSGTTVASFDIGGQCGGGTTGGTTGGGTTFEEEDENTTVENEETTGDGTTVDGTTVENEEKTTIENEEEGTTGGGTTVENEGTTVGGGTTVENEGTTGGDTDGEVDTPGGGTTVVEPPVTVNPPVVTKPPVITKPVVKKPVAKKPIVKKPVTKKPPKKVVKVPPKVAPKQSAACGKGILMIKNGNKRVVAGKSYACLSSGKMIVSAHAGKGVNIVGPSGLNTKAG